MHKIQKLKNNATLITVPVVGTEATTVLVLFPVGSRYENEKLSGASHFVEHLMFKGTVKRPNAQDVARTVEEHGAEYNAFTSKDFTGYYIKIDHAQIKIAFDLLSDMLFHSKFDPKEIERERGVIVEELRMYEDNPTMAVDQLFDRILFPNNPLGRDVGGVKQTVRAMTRTELFQYYKKAYRPENTVVVVAGKIKESEAKNLACVFEKETDKQPTNFDWEKFEKFSWPKNILLKNRVAVSTRTVDQTHIILGFPGLPNNHKDRYTLGVLLNILGGGMTSRLFVEVRERRGLAYMVRAGGVSYRDVGVVQIQSGLDSARLKEAVKVIKNELKKISTKKVSAKELASAKTNILGRLTLALEDSSFQADWFAKQFWFSNKIETYEDLKKHVNKVTVADVLRLAKKLFDWKQVRVAAIGPLKKDQIIKMI